MITFIVVAATLTLLVIVWIARAMLRPVPRTEVSSERLNASICRDQLQALDRDLERGVISFTDFQSTRDELQLRLLDDIDPFIGVLPNPDLGFWTLRRTVVALSVLIPLGSVGMYAWLGTPSAVDPVVSQSATDEQVLKMVESLAERLRLQPDNPKGWVMLARSYKVLGRLSDAEDAFVRAGSEVYNDASTLVDYADLIAAKTNSIDGKPIEMVNRALQLDPMQPTALMMSAIAAYQRGDFSAAVTQWEKLLTVLDSESPEFQQVQAKISQVRTQIASPDGAGGMTEDKINQMVQRLANRLKANPDDLRGWAQLGRAYKVQGRLEDAEHAYTKAEKLIFGDADLLTQFADVLASRAGNSLEGKPLALVNKALAINPKHSEALMMAGSAAYRRAEYAVAVRYWEAALSVLEPGSRDAVHVASELAEAKAKQ